MRRFLESLTTAKRPSLPLRILTIEPPMLYKNSPNRVRSLVVGLYPTTTGKLSGNPAKSLGVSGARKVIG